MMEDGSKRLLVRRLNRLECIQCVIMGPSVDVLWSMVHKKGKGERLLPVDVSMG